MAGRFSRPGLAVALGLLLCAGAASPAPAEIVRGESRELGIKFQVSGGDKWCRPSIRVQLTAEQAEALQPESIPFLQMIGRIRAVVLSQCPEIEFIAFEGNHRGATTFVAEMSRLTKWRRIVALDPSSRRPNCPPAIPDSECARQADAYLAATQLFRGGAFVDTEIVNTLEPDSNDLSFRAKDVIGKLRIIARSNFSGQFSTPAQFADAIAADLGEACTKDGGEAVVSGKVDPTKALARRGLQCRTAGRPDVQNIVVVRASADKFQVFSLWAEGAGQPGATSIADRLTATMTRPH